MSIGIYMDVHVRASITKGLRARGVDVLTAQEDGHQQTDDPTLLNRAGELRRIVFTNDKDFLKEATRRQREGIPFAGVLFARQQVVPIGKCIKDLAFFVRERTFEEVMNTVTYLPLKKIEN